MSLGPQFEQLKMLMTGNEVKNRVEDSYDRRPLFDGSAVDSVGDRVRLRDPGGGPASETMNEMWNRKLQESQAPQYSGHGSGVYDSMKRYGYNRDVPLTLNMNTPEGVVLSDGHHRVASAADLEDKGHEIYIPVQHWE